MDKVSIIIPYYKKKKYIQLTLNSILKQSYKNFEVFIVFDEETKENLSFINKLSKRDKRIKIIVNKKNLGAGFSRNKAIEKSRGKFIAFIDADDIWKKKKLELQLKFMQRNNIKISHTSYEIIDENNFKLGSRIAKTFYNHKELLESCDVGLSTVILKKNILGKTLRFPPLKTKEDFVLWLNILLKGYKICGFNKILSQWRSGKSSLSSSTYQKLIDGFRVYNIYMKFNFFVSLYFLIILSLNFLYKRFND